MASDRFHDPCPGRAILANSPEFIRGRFASAPERQTKWAYEIDRVSLVDLSRVPPGPERSCGLRCPRTGSAELANSNLASRLVVGRCRRQLEIRKVELPNAAPPDGGGRETSPLDAQLGSCPNIAGTGINSGAACPPFGCCPGSGRRATGYGGRTGYVPASLPS